MPEQFDDPMIESTKDDEEAAMDGVPENLQGSDRYCEMEAAVDAMDSAVCSLDEAIEQLSEIN